MNTRVLAASASVLLVVATVVAVVGAFSAGQPVVGTILGVAFLSIYAAGVIRASRAHAHFKAIAAGDPHSVGVVAWALTLVVLWLELFSITRAAMWLAFPLIIVEVGVLGVLWGSVVAGLLAVFIIAITVYTAPAGTPIAGAVLGSFLGSAVAVVISWAGLTMIMESAKLKRALTELGQARSLLARAEKDQILTRERQRMAGEIHDTVSQDLSGIAMLLRVAKSSDDPSLQRELLSQSLDATEKALIDTRRVTKALAPSELAGKRLSTALRDLPKEPVLSGLSVDFISEGEGSELSLGQEAALLRVAKSALVNVKEHSGTNRATVKLIFEAERVRLEVSDHGSGFAAPTPEDGRGLGIPTMRARLAEVGGNLDIETSEAGTLVRATIPTGEAE